MEYKLIRYIELSIKLIESFSGSAKLTKSESDEFNKISKDVIEFLITKPGGLIFIENKKRIKACKFAVEKVLELHTSDELYDEVLEGGFNGLMFDELDTYTSRVRRLRPTFLSITPDNKEFYTYYDEAMRCWLYGLNNSSIIIIATLLENILKERLSDFNQKEIIKILEIIRADEKFKRVEINFDVLIDIAEYKGWLSEENKLSAHRLRKKRNKIVHNGLNISSNEAIDLINKTKNIFEELYN